MSLPQARDVFLVSFDILEIWNADGRRLYDCLGLDLLGGRLEKTKQTSLVSLSKHERDLRTYVVISR